MGKTSLEELLSMLRRGTPLEEAMKDLEWKDFEGVVSDAFEANGFRTKRNLRFSHEKRRYEVDVVALERPRLVAVDCKHWGIRVGKGSALRAASLAQLNRAMNLGKKAHEIPGMGVGGWGEATIVPCIVTLYEERVVEHGGVMVVPLAKLNSFIEELRSGYFDFLKAKMMTMYSWTQR
jgi:hypothetical protein